MQISFRDWDDSALAQRAAAGLDCDEIQVWSARVPAAETDLSRFTAALSPDERERASRFIAPEPLCHFVFGRALLRQLLGACLNLDPATLAFGYQPRGKPYLSRPESGGDLCFNLSHSGRMMAIGLTRGREIGVDVESIERLDDWQLPTGRIFSPRDICELKSLPEAQQREAFFNGWTRKEAYLKATGEGLTDALPAIEVTLTPGKEPELLGLPGGPEAARPWAIRSIPLPPGYVGAVVFATTLSSPCSNQQDTH